MSEQVYTSIHYFTMQHIETQVSAKLAKVFDRLNNKLDRIYQRAIDAMADIVIRRLDL